AFQVDPGLALPTAPYNGGASGFGQPSIHDSMSFVSSTNSPGSLTGTQTLDVTLLTFRLGPSLFWDINDYVGLTVSAGPAVGFATGSLEFNENITVHESTGDVQVHNKGHVHSTDFVYGGYVSAVLTIHAVANGDVFVGAQYMPLSNANFSGSGRSA